ncbi:hypothetical protein D3C85_760980 [compost metagenome]
MRFPVNFSHFLENSHEGRCASQSRANCRHSVFTRSVFLIYGKTLIQIPHRHQRNQRLERRFVHKLANILRHFKLCGLAW